MASDEVEELIEQLQNGTSDNPDAEWQAAIALGEVSDEDDQTEAVTALLDVLDNGQSHALIRAHAVESLGQLGDIRAVEAVRNAMNNDSYRLVRAYAIAALSRLDGSPDNIDTLVDRLNNDNFFGVRSEAAASLGSIATNSTDDAVRQQVRQQLEARQIIEQTEQLLGAERVIAEIQRSLARIQ